MTALSWFDERICGEIWAEIAPSGSGVAHGVGVQGVVNRFSWEKREKNVKNTTQDPNRG